MRNGGGARRIKDGRRWIGIRMRRLTAMTRVYRIDLYVEAAV